MRITFLGIWLFCLAFAQEGRLPSVLKMHNEAVNAKKLASFGTIKISGLINYGSMLVPFESYQKGRYFRMEQKFGDAVVISVLTPADAWKVNPWNRSKVDLLTGAELRKLKEYSLPAGLLVGCEQLGYQVTSSADDSNSVLLVETPDAANYTVYLDTETHLIEKMVVQSEAGEKKQKVLSKINKYMEHRGVQFPSVVQEYFQGELMVSYSVVSIDTDVELDMNLFKKPNGGE